MKFPPLIGAPASGPVITATWIGAMVLFALRLDAGFILSVASGLA
jgi:hypothetical protein